MSALLAHLDDLTVTYAGGDRLTAALDRVDLGIAAGKRLAIIGESGSGKSTLALALAGLLPVDALVSGRIDWLGFESPPIPGRDIGFIFQDAGASLNPVRRVGDQIAEVARQHKGLSWQDAGDRALHLMARVQLPEPEKLYRAYAHQLSGGQRQRVAIAAAIAGGPRLLIADEPTSALDMIVQAEIVALLDGLVREDGMTLVFITHDVALASGFADEVAVLHRARLVEFGRTSDVLGAPTDAYTKSLLASTIDLGTTPLIAGAAL